MLFKRLQSRHISNQLGHNMEMGGTRCENVQVLSYSLKILTHLHEELKLLSI